MPFLILVGWFSHKPMTLLFDLFEVSVLLGACFLVNYVTADAKTNWCEGLMMVIFYLMICITAWYYPGQPEIRAMATCSHVLRSMKENNLAEHNLTAHNLTLAHQAPQQAAVGPQQTHTLHGRLEKVLKVYRVEETNA
jgi:Ca2+/Na+ antiporter